MAIARCPNRGQGVKTILPKRSPEIIAANPSLASVIGSTMGSRDQLARLASFLEQTGTRPRIDRALPLADAREGFAAMISGDLFGKIVFTR